MGRGEQESGDQDRRPRGHLPAKRIENGTPVEELFGDAGGEADGQNCCRCLEGGSTQRLGQEPLRGLAGGRVVRPQALDSAGHKIRGGDAPDAEEGTPEILRGGGAAPGQRLSPRIAKKPATDQGGAGNQQPLHRRKHHPDALTSQRGSDVEEQYHGDGEEPQRLVQGGRTWQSLSASHEPAEAKAGCCR